MGHKKKTANNSDIPQNAIETIARCILTCYKSEEGQREFQEWIAKKEPSEEQEVA